MRARLQKFGITGAIIAFVIAPTVWLHRERAAADANAEAPPVSASDARPAAAPAAPVDDHGQDHGEAHGDGDSHDAHGHSVHDEAVRLQPEELADLNITLKTAAPGHLDIGVTMPGEVRLNEDRLAHVVPKLAGIVSEVTVSLGDDVKKGDVMAILESRELATAKSEYLAAREHLNLATANFEREQKLWKEKISAQKDFLEAQNQLASARIALQGVRQELEALGFNSEYIDSLRNESGASLTRYVVTAPFDGTVISKHLALGEYVEANAAIYTVSDLSTVWVDLQVYQKDLAAVREGQAVVVSAQAAIPDASATIAYVGPLVGEATRTALARVVLPNPEGHWRPGLFVTAKVMVDAETVPIRVEKTALHEIAGVTHVFVRDEHGFEPAPVVLGRADRTGVEVLEGLQPGQTYVATGGFHLKAELNKEAFGSHGHSH